MQINDFFSKKASFWIENSNTILRASRLFTVIAEHPVCKYNFFYFNNRPFYFLFFN